MSVIDTLVTNRGAGAKYNFTDLNRVEAAFEYLRDKMNSEYGFDLHLTIKTDWAMNDIPIQSQMEAYLQNVVDIRGAIALPTGTPQAPESMRFLTAEQANNIEKILGTVEDMLNLMKQAWTYSGEHYSGEV